MEEYDNEPMGESCWDAWLRTLNLRNECREGLWAAGTDRRECVKAANRWIRSIKLMMDMEKHLFDRHLAA